jgi:DNA primase
LLSALVGLVQMGVLEVPYLELAILPHRAADRILIDIDPGEPWKDYASTQQHLPAGRWPRSNGCKLAS